MLKVSIQRSNWIHLLPRFWCCSLAKGPGGDLYAFWSLLSEQIRPDIIFISARMINAHERIIYPSAFLKDGRACFRTDLKIEKRITKRQWYSATRAVCCSEHLLGQIPRRGSLVQSAFKNVNAFDNVDGHLPTPEAIISRKRMNHNEPFWRIPWRIPTVHTAGYIFLRCHGCRISALCGAPPGSLCGWPEWWTTTNGATSGRSFCWNSNLGAMRLGRCGCGVFGKKRPKVMNNYKIIRRSVYCS